MSERTRLVIGEMRRLMRIRIEGIEEAVFLDFILFVFCYIPPSSSSNGLL